MIDASTVRSNSDRMRTKGIHSNETSDHLGNGWHNRCLEHVRTAAGAPGMGGTAYDAWLRVPEALRHPAHANDPDDVPPAGAPVFWRSKVVPGQPEGDGHVVVSRGDWSCNTNDFVRNGYLDIADIRDITKGWGLTYLGWTETVNGARITGFDQPMSAGLPKNTTVSLVVVRHAFEAALSNSDVVAVKAALHAEGVLPLFWKGPKVGRTTRRGYAKWQIRLSTAGRRLADGIPTEGDLRALGAKQGFKVDD
jgi:hypothetical protein